MPKAEAIEPRPETRRSPRKKHRLYVVDLDPRVWRDRATMRKANPKYMPSLGKGFAYVGMTSHTAEERLAIHKAGGLLSAPVVRRYGRELVPELYKAYKLMSQPDAEEMERYLAQRLRRKGYAVWPVKDGGAFTMGKPANGTAPRPARRPRRRRR